MKKYIFLIIGFLSIYSCKFSKTEIEKKETTIDSIREVKIDTLSIVKKENICINGGSDLSNFIFSIDDQYHNEYYQYWDEIIPFFNNAEKHVEEALYLLRCSNLSEYQKRNLIDIMNGLPFKENLEFRNKCYEMYSCGEFSSTLINNIIYNAFNQRFFIYKYYKSPSVVKLLNEIKKDTTLTKSASDIKNIEEILSGKTLEILIENHSQPYAPELDLNAW